MTVNTLLRPSNKNDLIAGTIHWATAGRLIANNGDGEQVEAARRSRPNGTKVVLTFEPNHDGRVFFGGTWYTRDNGEWIAGEQQAVNYRGEPLTYTVYSEYVEAANEWFTEPWEHGYERCAACDAYDHTDRGRWASWGDFYCREHEDQSYDDDHYDCDCEECYDGRGGTTVPTCASCRTSGVTHWHPVTEDTYCEDCAPADGERIPELVAA